MKTKNVIGKGKPGPGRPKGEPKRRVHVTLSLDAWAMVEEISDLTGSPKATILAEIFDETLPAFHNTLQALRVAKEQPREAQRLVTNFAAESVMKLHQQQLEFDRLVTDHEAKNKGKKPARRRTRAGTT